MNKNILKRKHLTLAPAGRESSRMNAVSYGYERGGDYALNRDGEQTLHNTDRGTESAMTDSCKNDKNTIKPKQPSCSAALNLATSPETNHSLKRKLAFTLAEVLITLGIIGVVAALTLPSLISSYQKKQTVQQLKAAYSLLSQAVEQSISENGEIHEWNYSLSFANFDNTYILPYLKVIKKCEGAECITTDDFHGYYELNDNKYTAIDKSYILSNGMILMKDSHGLGMGFIVYMVDINGNKKPNKMGKDIFSFYLFNLGSLVYDNHKRATKYFKSNLYLGSLDCDGIPHYYETRDYLLSSKSHRACNKVAAGGHSGVGSACAAVIMKDNWKISKDYPW